MRATRAYVAGFGTAGSLVAGAAILFVLASAVVSFRGLTPVTVPGSPATVAAGSKTVADVHSSASRRLAAAARVPTSRPAASAAKLVSTTATPSVPSTGRSLKVQPGTSVSTSGMPQSQSPTRQPSSGAATPSSSNPLTGVVKSTTGKLGNTLNSTGQALGSAVNRLTGTLAGALSGTSASLAATVQRLGGALAGVIGQTGSAAGRLIAGLGTALSGGR